MSGQTQRQLLPTASHREETERIKVMDYSKGQHGSSFQVRVFRLGELAEVALRGQISLYLEPPALCCDEPVRSRFIRSWGMPPDWALPLNSSSVSYQPAVGCLLNKFKSWSQGVLG
jgi:hypothetical protein